MKQDPDQVNKNQGMKAEGGLEQGAHTKSSTKPDKFD